MVKHQFSKKKPNQKKHYSTYKFFNDNEKSKIVALNDLF